jgi:hypothetical protein
VENGLVGVGRVLPTLPLLQNADILLVLDGRGVGVSALLTGESLTLPGPFSVTGGLLELYAGTGGLEASGRVFFEIERLARGSFGATVRPPTGTESGFELAGELEFDTSIFTEARLGLRYRSTGGWSVTGRLAVGPGKVAGIRSATVDVTVDDALVSATGTFLPSIRGLERGTLSFLFDPATGMDIAGALVLGALPGIRGGTVDARIAQRSDGQGWSLSGSVSAAPAIPGVEGTISGRYEDGAFLVDADLGYRRGMLDGRVRIGLTNQAVGADGQPAGPATDALLAYGRGIVTLQLAPWLQGTIGLELRPNGEMVVTGRVGLPAALELFPEKRVDRNIFTIGVDIPIVGVAVAGQRIGIFATIRGGLDVFAGVGPGQLRTLEVEVAYNPDREADTRVSGRAQLHVPAAAGLRLFVRGGLGAGIPVVSATAGVEIAGALGLEGALQAGVDVLWTPTNGLVVDALGELFAEPKLRFTIDAFVDVSADLVIDTIELYSRRWNLAAFEYGSNLRFGVAFPVHYEEGQPFDLRLDDVRFTYPAIDPTEVLGGLVRRLTE